MDFAQLMKRNFIKVAASLGFAQLALLNCASAQDTTALKEVIVTASRSPRKKSEIGKVVNIIDSKQIERSQGRSLSELLNNVAGLTIGGGSNAPGDNKSVYLRGAKAGYTLILIDGIPVNDASTITGEYDINTIAIDQIERIEVVKGGSSTLYGSDAVAGVINVITKKGKGDPSVSLLATGGSYRTFKQALGINGQFEKTSVSLNISNTDNRGFSTAIGKGNVTDGFDRDGFHQKAVNLVLKQDVSDKVSLRGNVQYSRYNTDLDNGAFTDEEDFTFGKTASFYGLGANIKLKKGNFDLNVSENRLKNKYDNSFGSRKNTGRILDVEALYNRSLVSFLDLTAGASFKHSATDQSSAFSSLSADSANNNITSTFASLFLKTPAGFNFELGGRYNYHSEFGDKLTYTINPSFVLDNKYKLFAGISSAYKVPSLYQLYSEYGNIDLKPESSTSYEAGFDLDIISGKLNFNVSGFIRDIENLIDFGATGYANLDAKQKDKGYEAELFVKPCNIFSIRSFYSYVEGEVEQGGIKSFNLYRRPKNTVGANTNIIVTDALDFNVIYKWTDKRYDRYYDSSILPYGGTVQVPLHSYHTFDVYGQYKPLSTLTIFADVKNIFDRNYTEFAGYQTKGTNFNVGLKYIIK